MLEPDLLHILKHLYLYGFCHLFNGSGWVEFIKAQRDWTMWKKLGTEFLQNHVVVVQLPSHVRLFATSWTAARQASPSFTISWSFFKLMSTQSETP